MTGGRLSVVEVHRVTAILEDTVEKLSFLASIKPDIVQHRDELSKVVGDEISRIIQEQRALEIRYEHLTKERGDLKGLANKSRYKENQNELREVSRSLRESTKNLCKSLRDNPNISVNLMKIQHERSALENLLSNTVQELKQTGQYDGLRQHLQEAQTAYDKVADVVRKEKEASAMVKKLDEELKVEKATYKKEMEDLQATIAKLKEELKQLKSDTVFNLTYHKSNAQAKTNNIIRVHEKELSSAKEEIDSLQLKKKREDDVHRNTVEYLQKKQQQLLDECAGWGEKYQNDIEAKELDLNDLLKERDLNLAILEQLKSKLREVQAKDGAKALEQQRKQELQRLKILEMERRDKAARKIQHEVRKLLRTKKKSGSAGSKDKKSKKGGRKKKK